MPSGLSSGPLSIFRWRVLYSTYSGMYYMMSYSTQSFIQAGKCLLAWPAYTYTAETANFEA